MKRLFLIAALGLAGCAHDPTTLEPVVKTETVKVPVPVHCKPDIGPEPVYPDTPEALKAAPNLYERVKLLLAGRVQRTQRLIELRAALTACE
jgi:hypothetical protein